MTSALEFIDAGFAMAWTQALLRASMQGGIAIAVIGLVLRLLPTLPPAVHVWAWRIMLAKLLIGLALTAPLIVAADGRAPASIAEASIPIDFARIVVVLSAIGGLAVLGALVGDLITARRLRRVSIRCLHPALPHEALRLARALGIRRPPEVRESHEIDRPMLLGAGRPLIVLPVAMARDESMAALSAIIGHELAHHRRRDLAWGTLPAAVQVVFFFHPLVWVATTLLRRAQDQACDALALRHSGTGPAEYGETLLRLSSSLRGAAMSMPLAAGAIDGFRALRTRLLNLERRNVPRRATPIVAIALICMALAPTWRVQKHAVTDGPMQGLGVAVRDDSIGVGPDGAAIDDRTRLAAATPQSPALRRILNTTAAEVRREPSPARRLASAVHEKPRTRVTPPLEALQFHSGRRVASPVRWSDRESIRSEQETLP